MYRRNNEEEKKTNRQAHCVCLNLRFLTKEEHNNKTKRKKNRRPHYAHLGNNCIKTNIGHIFAFTTLGGPGFFGMPPVWSQKKKKDKLQQHRIEGHFYGHI